MGPNHGLFGVLALAAISGCAASATGQEPEPRSSRTRPTIAQQIERHVREVLRAHEDPCARADRLGIPCFPVITEIEGPRYSVQDGLRQYRPDGRPAPGTPTNAEVREHLSGRPQSASGGVSFDPGCALKSLKRLFSGSPSTFYLYRFTDAQGARPLLTDRKIDTASYGPRPDVRYEFLGTYSGECEAVAAWRKALRESHEAGERREAPAPPAERPAAETGVDP